MRFLLCLISGGAGKSLSGSSEIRTWSSWVSVHEPAEITRRKRGRKPGTFSGSDTQRGSRSVARGKGLGFGFNKLERMSLWIYASVESQSPWPVPRRLGGHSRMGGRPTGVARAGD
eukprot:1048332-Rhodomonas_salina.2